MPVTVWDAAMVAVRDCLASALADVEGLEIEMDRDADVAEDERPRLVVTQGTTPAPDLTQDPGNEHHEVEVLVSGYAAPAATRTEARIAINALRARVMAALNGLAVDVVFDVLAVGGEGAQLYPVGESALPAGDFTQPFTVRCITASGHPYTD